MEASLALLERAGRLIEALRSIVERYVGHEEKDLAQDAVSSLAARMRERVTLEETVLFPRIEKLLGDPRLPLTARMRRQHLVLLELVAGVERALREPDFNAAAGDLRELRAALKAHLEEERRVLLPIVGAEGRGCA